MDSTTLKSFTHRLLERLQELPENALQKMLKMNDYHGFSKSKLPQAFLSDVLDQFELKAQNVQVEIVQVTRNLKDQVHYHRHSSAYVVCLGEDERLENPRSAYAFLANSWKPIDIRQEFEISAGTPHGFTVGPGGNLYFLSVQSPPIVGEDGLDDYFLCE